MAKTDREPLWIETLMEGILPRAEVRQCIKNKSRWLYRSEIAYVYGLFRRDTNELIYVGQSTNPDMRLIQHRMSTVKDCKEWIEMELLQVCPKFQVERHESWWIDYARYLGCPLRNRTFNKSYYTKFIMKHGVSPKNSRPSEEGELQQENDRLKNTVVQLERRVLELQRQLAAKPAKKEVIDMRSSPNFAFVYMDR